MRVSFLISDRPKQTLTLSLTATIGSARSILSNILRVPESSLTFLHLARPLSDSTIVQSLNFSARNFITVHVEKNVRYPIVPREQRQDPAVQAIIAILQRMLRDVTMPFREYLLSNPGCLPELLRSVARTDPVNGSTFASSPHLLLALFGITPDEYLEALNRAHPPPEPERDPVELFINGLTREDLIALGRVMSADVTLDEALPIFLEQNKDVAATIDEINRIRQAGGGR
jgi:hypothetical protein